MNRKGYVYYIAPDDDGRPLNCFLTIKEAIELQKAAAATVGYVYTNDEEALSDFMAVHWASFDAEDFFPPNADMNDAMFVPAYHFTPTPSASARSGT